MKKIIALSVLSLALHAQKTDKISIDFKTKLHPRNIISSEALVDIVVKSNYIPLKDERTEQVRKMEEDQANKSTGRKILEKGLSQTVFDPGNPKPQDIYIPTVIGEESEGLFKIPGITESDSAKGVIEIVFYPLEISDLQSDHFLYTPLKADIKITNDKGLLIYEGSHGMIRGAHTYSIAPGSKIQSCYKDAEKKAKEETVTMINKFLAEEYGYLILKDDRNFFDVKDKKHSYAEYHTAIEKARLAMAYCGDMSKEAEQQTAFTECVSLWQESLKSCDKINKDARINREIAAITYLNLAEAFIWLNNFEQSREALVQYNVLGVDYSRAEQNIKTFLVEYEKRHMAYKKYKEM